MQRRSLLLLITFVVLGFARASRADGTKELNKLTIDQVAAKLGTKNTYIFDNNPKESWVAGHVPGAKWLDDEKVTAADLPADKAATLIFYCHNEG